MFSLLLFFPSQKCYFLSCYFLAEPRVRQTPARGPKVAAAAAAAAVVGAAAAAVVVVECLFLYHSYYHHCRH